MSNWKGIIKNSPEVKDRISKSKGKFTPRRDPNSSQDHSFIQQLKEKSFSKDKSFADSNHGLPTSRSQVNLNNRVEIQRKRTEFESETSKGARPPSPTKSGREPINKQVNSRQNLVSKKNEVEIMKLKRQFLEFQRTVFKELKKQEAVLNQMVELILSQVRAISQKNSQISKKSIKEESNFIPKLNFEGTNNFTFKKIEEQPAPKLHIQSRYSPEKRETNLKLLSENSKLSKNQASKSFDYNRLLSAVHKLKQGMKQISNLSDISLPENYSSMVK